MFVKKVILYSLLAGLVGLLVFGAVNRTLARSDESGSAGQGIQRNYQSSESVSVSESQTENLNEAQNQNYGQGQGSSSNFRSEGNEEGNEDHQPLGEGTGYGAGSGSGNQRGGSGSGNQTGNYGEGQAQVTDTLAMEGTVVSVDENTLVLETTGGETIEITNRGWWYAVESGFSAQVGDQLSVTGFFESEDHFEVISMENLTNGQSISLREETGRPMWAGGGRGRGGNQ